MKVQLFVAPPGKGELFQVADDPQFRLVHEAQIPPFVVPPGVITWGTRVFVRDFERAEPPLVYIEAFAYFLPVSAANPPSQARPLPEAGPSRDDSEDA